jgi:hypothetical protein
MILPVNHLNPFEVNGHTNKLECPSSLYPKFFKINRQKKTSLFTQISESVASSFDLLGSRNTCYITANPT